jgi:hypothetical protein
LNPFGKPNGRGTGTALFDNANERDLQVLFGERPFELRVQTERPSDLSGVMRQGPLKTWLIENNFINEQGAIVVC